MLPGSRHEHEALAVAPTRRNYLVTLPPGQAGMEAAGRFTGTVAFTIGADTYDLRSETPVAGPRAGVFPSWRLQSRRIPL